MTDAQTEARAIAQRLERAVKRAEEHAGMMPARQAVKIHPNDWHAVCDLAREAATALAAKDAELAEVKAERDRFLAKKISLQDDVLPRWIARAERAEAQLAKLLAADEVRARDISRLTIERDEARAQLAETRKALEPFAAFASFDPVGTAYEGKPDDTAILFDHKTGTQITLADLRAARRAREAQGGENGQA